MTPADLEAVARNMGRLSAQVFEAPTWRQIGEAMLQAMGPEPDPMVMLLGGDVPEACLVVARMAHLRHLLDLVLDANAHHERHIAAGRAQFEAYVEGDCKAEDVRARLGAQGYEETA